MAADWSDVDAEPECSASSMATANLATACAPASLGADAKASPDAAAAATRQQPGSPASVDAPVPQTGDRLAAEHAIVDDWVWPVRQVCEGGRPSRPIIVDSLCAGTETEMYGFRTAAVFPVRLRVVVEKKESASKWLRAQRLRWDPECRFEDVREVASSGAAWCLTHRRRHAPPGGADLLVAGVVCKPFSQARQGRFADGGVEAHVDADIGQAALAYVRRTRPNLVLIENVSGWNKRSRVERGRDDPSPMDKMRRKLEALGYAAQCVHLDVCVWSQCRRDRVYMLGARKDCLASPDAATRGLDLALKLTEEMVALRATRPPMTVGKMIEIADKHRDQDRRPPLATSSFPTLQSACACSLRVRPSCPAADS